MVAAWDVATVFDYGFESAKFGADNLTSFGHATFVDALSVSHFVFECSAELIDIAVSSYFYGVADVYA